MAEEYVSTDPNAGLEKEQPDYLSTDPSAGLGRPSVGQILKTAGEAAIETAKGFARGLIPKANLSTLAEIVTPVLIPEIEAYKQGQGIIDTVHQVQEAEQTPAFSKERFEAGFSVVAQMGMLAGFAKGRPRLADVAFGEKPIVEGETPATNEAVSEVQPKEGGETSAIEERKIQTGIQAERPGDGKGGTPAEAGGGGGVQPTAEIPREETVRAEPTHASIGDTVSFKHATLGELSGTVDRELADGSFNVKTDQGDVVIDPSEITAANKGEASQRQDKVPTPAMEARMQREHEAEIMSDYKEHMQRGGDELGDVLKRVGLPSLSSARKQFSGELQRIREAWQGTRGDPNKPRIRYADIFKKDAPDIDEFAQTLKRAGFDVETPADALDLVEQWMTQGKPIYGSEARAQTLSEASFGMGAARAGEIPEGSVTGMKNRIVDDERSKRGWLPLMEPARQAMGTVWDKAMERVEAGEKSGENIGSKMVDDILNYKKKDISEVDQGVLMHERIRVQNERDMSADRVNDPHTSIEDRVEAQNAWATAEDRLNQTEIALHEAGTISGRALQIRQSMVRNNFTFAGMERRARASKGGEPLTPEESEQIKTMSDRISELEAQLGARKAEVEETGAQQAFDESITGLKKRARSEKGPENLDDQRERIQNALMDRAEEGDGAEDVGGLIHQLALNFVRSGVTEREPLLDAVHNVVGDIFGLEREETRNAMSGYGKYHQLDPEAAKVTLRQLNGENQQVAKLLDMAEGIAPKKTGMERRTPSDEERRLIREVNEMKKKGGFEVTDPATQLKSALDAVKTRLRNQIRDIHNAITNREPIVNKKGELQYDDETNKLKGMRDVLKAHYDEIFGKPGMTDEQRLKVAQSAAERSLRDWNTRLDEAQKGIFKRPDKTKLSSPEIDAIRAQRESVKAEVEALAKLDPSVQVLREQQALATYKARITQRIADIQEKIASGDFNREQRKPLPIDKEVLQLQARAQEARDEFDRGILKKQLENRTRGEWIQDTFLKYRRAFVLSWPTIFTKLTSAAFLRMVSEPIEAGIGAGLRQIPGIKQIAERAEIGGATNAKTIASATASAFTDGMKDSWQTLRTGKSDLDRLYGRRDVMPREWVDFFGTMHAVLKAPVKRYGFELAMRDQIEHGLRYGVDVNDPFIQTQMALRAYAHGERLIFLQNNRAVSAFNMAMRRLEAPEKETGRPSPSGKLTATVLKTPLPVMKVPTNILAEMFDYTLGGYNGGIKVFQALKEPIDNLNPQQAETIMRQLKKGSLGGALLLLGYMNRQSIGGYFQRGEKRPKDQPQPEEVVINGHHFGREIFHSAVTGPLMIGATIGRVADSRIKGVPRGIGEGIMEALIDPITSVPFFTGPERIIEAAKAPSKTTAAGEFASDIIVPGAVQYAARATDKTPEGDVVKRVAQGPWQALEAKIPFLRKNVPEKASSRTREPFGTVSR